MSDHALIAAFSTLEEAQQAALELVPKAGLQQVSVVCRGDEDILERNETLHLSREDAPEILHDASIGGIIGAAVAVPISIAAAGPAAILVGPLAAAAGGVIGGFIGVMSGWGIHADHVHEYERWVAEGKTLLLIEGDPERLARLESLLDDVADEVHLHLRTSDDSPEI